MAVTEQSRHDLHQKLDTVLGAEEATTLMEHLPPIGWADVATKQDLDHHTALLGATLRAEMADLRTEMADLRTELRAEMADLRTEMAELRTEVRSEIAEVRSDMGGLRADIVGQTQGMFHRLTLQLLAAQFAFVTVVLVVARVG